MAAARLSVASNAGESSAFTAATHSSRWDGVTGTLERVRAGLVLAGLASAASVFNFASGSFATWLMLCPACVMSRNKLNRSICSSE